MLEYPVFLHAEKINEIISNYASKHNFQYNVYREILDKIINSVYMIFRRLTIVVVFRQNALTFGCLYKYKSLFYNPIISAFSST